MTVPEPQQESSREISSREQTFNKVALWSVLLLGFIGLIGLFVYSLSLESVTGWIVAGLVVLVTPVLAYAAFQRLKDRIVESGIEFVAVTLSVLAIFVLGLWFWVTFDWTARLTQERPLEQPAQTEFEVDGTPYVAHLEFPAQLQQGAAPSELTVRILPSEILTHTQPITASVHIDIANEGLKLLGAPTSQLLVVPPDPAGNSVKWTVVNTANVSRDSQPPSITATISSTVGTTLNEPVVLARTVPVESDAQFRLRRFVTTTVDQSTPLILFMALALPILAALADRWITSYEKKRDARETNETERLVDTWRKAFKGEDLKKVYPALADIQNRAPNFLENSKSRKQLVTELKLGQHLLVLAELKPLSDIRERVGNPSEGDTADVGINETQSSEPRVLSNDVRSEVLAASEQWPDGFGYAFLHAHGSAIKKSNPVDFVDLYREARHKIDLSVANYNGAITNYELQADLRIARVKDVTEGIHQPVRQNKGNPPPSILPIAASSWVEFAQQPAKAPFEHHDARKAAEQQFLRAGGFWDGHPTFQMVKNSDRSMLIYGSAGCGLTAFAEMIYPHHFSGDDSVLVMRTSCHDVPRPISGVLRSSLIQEALTYPTYLYRLSDHHYRFLATMICESFGKLSATIKVESALGNLKGLPGLEDPREASEKMIHYSRQIDEAKRELRLLDVAIHHLNETDIQPARGEAKRKRSDEGFLSEDVRELMTAMGIERSVFVIDISSQRHCRAWLRTTILDRLEEWDDNGVRFYLFVAEDDKYISDIKDRYRNLDCQALRWNADQLQQMAIRRFDLVSFKRARWLGRFEPPGPDKPSAERELLEASRIGPLDDYSPKRFIQLWQQIVGDRTNESVLITVEDVRRAIESS